MTSIVLAAASSSSMFADGSRRLLRVMCFEELGCLSNGVMYDYKETCLEGCIFYVVVVRDGVDLTKLKN